MNLQPSQSFATLGRNLAAAMRLDLALDYVPETWFEAVDAGEASQSASLALIYDHTDPSGAQLTGTFVVKKCCQLSAADPRTRRFRQA